MRTLLLVTAALIIAATVAAKATPKPTPHADALHDEASYLDLFAKFKKEYNRHYKNTDAEATAFGHFAFNMRAAAAVSKENPHATFGYNEFSDLSEAEFKSRHNAESYYEQRLQERQRNTKNNKNATEAAERGAEALAAVNVDWRTAGVVTAVKNQGGCGDCWAFSAAQNIESQWALAGHGLVSLSPQQLCSCDTNDGACSGGLMDNAFAWLMSTQGGWITSDAAYPYTSGTSMQRGTCQTGKPRVAQITGHVDVTPTESAMAAWVAANGPMSIAIASPAWQSYRGGILTNCGTYSIDHGVLVVGVNTVNNPPYWIIKNSWGPSWGEQGYIRVAYGSNQCRITTIPSSAIVPKAANPVPTPAPTPKPTPATAVTTSAPQPAAGTFTQYQCSSTDCRSGCTPVSYPVGQCLPYRSGQSAIASCSGTNLVMSVYSGSACSGAATTVSQPTNQCTASADGTRHFYDVCRAAAPTPSPTPNPPPAPSGTFVQHQCGSSATCGSGCTAVSYPLGTCLPYQTGQSAIASCTATSLVVTVYPNTGCSGSTHTTTTQTLNQCLSDSTGTRHFYDICSGVSSTSTHKKSGTPAPHGLELSPGPLVKAEAEPTA